MSTAAPGRSRSVATTARLLGAATDAFAERGYHATRVDDIVERAGTSHGTFYLYFASKDAVFTALVEGVSEDFGRLAGQFPRLEPTAEGRAALASWLDDFAALYARHWPMLRSWNETERPDGPAGELATALIGRLSGAMAQNVTGRRARQPHRELGSLALIGLIERLAYHVESGQTARDRPAQTAMLTDAIMATWFADTRR